MKKVVTDDNILAKCRDILDKWSAGQAYSPTSALGSESEFVAAEAHSLERFTLSTSYRVRFKHWSKMPKGTDYCSSPKGVNDYDIWEDVLASTKTQDFDYGIEDTAKREDCPNSECHD